MEAEMQATSEVEGGEGKAAVDKLDRASDELVAAIGLLKEVADGRPKGDKPREEIELLEEEVRDVYVRVRAARDGLGASAATGS
jgi:hypothetical protein